MGADGAHVGHFPGARLISISAGGERADGAYVDAHAALFAIEVILAVGRDDGAGAAVLDAERPHVHAFAAYADAAVAEDAAGTVKEDDGGPLLLVAVLLDLDEFRFVRAVFESHVLQLALAAGVTDRAIEGMVAEQHFNGGFARLRDLRTFGGDDHALGDRGGACGLQLRHFFDANDTHAARGLEREAGVVAEGRDLDAVGAAGFNEQRARGSAELLAVDGEGNVSHSILQTNASAGSCER